MSYLGFSQLAVGALMKSLQFLVLLFGFVKLVLDVRGLGIALLQLQDHPQVMYNMYKSAITRTEKNKKAATGKTSNVSKAASLCKRNLPAPRDEKVGAVILPPAARGL